MLASGSRYPASDSITQLWKGVPKAPEDAIFGVQRLYEASTVPGKQSVTVGTMLGEDGGFYSYPSVLHARAIISQQNTDYPPMLGEGEFIQHARELLLGPGRHPDVQSCQSFGGTGGIFYSASLFKDYGGEEVIVPVPAWPNYHQLFQGVGLKIRQVNHLKDNGFNCQGLLDEMGKAPRPTLVVVQTCGHNPTGVDPSKEQFDEISRAARRLGHFLLLDVAYVGYVSGDFGKDTEMVRSFVKTGQPGFISLSFSKCMALYGDRIGLMSVCGDKTGHAVGQAAHVGRCFATVPAKTGADCVTYVLKTPQLRQQWLTELREARDRIVRMRKEFCDCVERLSGRDFSHVRKQNGFFAWSGLNEKQVKWCWEQGLFLPGSGRITIAALNPENVCYVGEKVATALKM